MLEIQVNFQSVFFIGCFVGFFEFLILFLECNKFCEGPNLFTSSVIRFHTLLHQVD